MTLQVDINSTDRTDHIVWDSLMVQMNLTDEVDTARFTYRKGPKAYTPAVSDTVEVYDGGTKIFGGQIVNVRESVMSGADSLKYDIDCVDHTYAFDSELVAKTYENQTVKQIIDDIVSSFTDGSFTTNNVSSTFTVEKIVFNQVEPSQCLKKLAQVLNYYWYIDPDKDIHFFPILAESAPFDITDSNGNLVYKSLIRQIDGTQIANRVVVRGGLYNEASTYTDEITVKGNTSSSFKLPYQMANLAIRLDTGGGFSSQTVGTEYIDDFTSSDVLYDYQQASIRFENALSDGDVIEFSGNRKIRVLAVSEDSDSISEFGLRSKFLRDNSIESNTIARKRAQAELARYKDTLDALDFMTYESGLNAGMTMELQSDLRGIDTEYIIQTISFRPLDPNTFGYKVKLVNTRGQTFQQLLAKLFEPDPLISDEQETSEPIQTDFQEVNITETITNVTPEEDIQTVTISEDIQKDPLGANTEPTWVLAMHIPDPWPTDPKRNGLLDRTMKLT